MDNNLTITRQNILAQKDNLAFFMSADCTTNAMVAEVLVEKNKIDQKSMLACIPEVGDILIARHGLKCYFTMICKNKSTDSPNRTESGVQNCLKTLINVLNKLKLTSCTIAKSENNRPTFLA